MLPFSDLAAHVAPPLAMQCVWSPNDRFILVILANLSSDELTGVRITARTTAGPSRWMEAARDCDLTRITPRSTVMMGVRTFHDAPGELPLVIEVTYEPNGKTRFDEGMPESAERYEFGVSDFPGESLTPVRMDHRPIRPQGWVSCLRFGCGWSG